MSTSNPPLSVAIIGGGMGGLAAACAMGRAGLTVDIFEQAPAFGEVGAGLNLGPNTVRTLGFMGLGEAYDAVAEVDKAGGLFFEWWDGMKDVKHGETYTKYPRSAVHRARLLECLHDSLPETVTIHLGVQILGVSNSTVGNTKKGRVHFTARGVPKAEPPKVDLKGGAQVANGSQTAVASETPMEEYFEADVVVGADGVKSLTRTLLELPAPPEAGSKADRPSGFRYTGTYCYRALIPMDQALKVDPPNSEAIGNTLHRPRMAFGPGRHFTIFPIEQHSILNVVAFVSDRSKPKDQREWSGPWLKKVDHETILKDFEGWDEHYVNLLKLVPESQRIQWAMHEVLSPKSWRKGRVTLLGDSAHGSLPHNGSGASMAIEDAYVLAGLLARPECNADNVEAFLDAYEEVRRPRSYKQLLHACETGEMFDWSTEKWGRDTSKIANEMLTRTDWIWDYDIRDGLADAVKILEHKGLMGTA